MVGPASGLQLQGRERVRKEWGQPPWETGGLSKQGLGVTSEQDTGGWLRMDSGVTRTESAHEEVRLRLGGSSLGSGTSS